MWNFADLLFYDFNIGSKLKVTVNILTSEPLILGIYKVGSKNMTLTQMNIPSSNKWEIYSLTSTNIPDDTSLIRIRLMQATANPHIVYIDNIIVEEI